MRAKQQFRPELYGTKQVAEILNIPEWRVKNFSEGAAYRLPPAHRIGSGRGSRRLYGWVDIFRIAIAEHLVVCGFTADAVGSAIEEIPNSTLEPYQEKLLAEEPRSEGRLTAKETPLLICAHGSWRVHKGSDVRTKVARILKHSDSPDGLFMLNLATFCDRVFRRLNAYWSQ